MKKCRVELEELNYDHDNIQREEQFSLFEYADDVEELGPENRKRADGTYTNNPSMEGYTVRGEEFEINSDYDRDR